MFFLKCHLRDEATDTNQGGGATAKGVNSVVDSAIKAEVKADETNKEEVKPAEKKEEPKKEPQGLSDVDKVQAEQLFVALKDPEKSAIIIQYLAEQAGYAKVETKKEAAEIKDEVLDILKESLGADFDFLAPKLAPAIKKIVDTQVKENVKDIRADMNKNEETRLTNKAEVKQKEIAKEFFDTDAIPDNVLDEMSKMMDKLPPGKDISVEEYVETIFNAAAGKLKLTPSNKNSKERVEKNKTDVISRLASGGAKHPDASSVESKKMSLDEAVKNAIASVKME